MYNTELYHYGVKGMKWGVRRYQNKDGSLTPAGRERYNTGSRTSSERAHDLVSSNSKRSVSELVGGASDSVALLAPAAVYAATMAAVAISVKVSEKRNRKKKAQELEDLNKNKDIKSFDDAPKLSKKMSPADSAQVTNPEFPSMGTTMNCTFCTTAMALREKGYDVKAAKLSDGWYSDDLFNSTFNSPEVKMKGLRRSSEAIDKLSSCGDGAYGNLTVAWKLGGQHSIFWKNENGTTNFYDGQSGKAYTSFSDKNDLLKNVYLSNSRYNRLDNCEPTEYALAVVERNKK